MISISKLLCDLDAEGDALRYDAAAESSKPQITDEKQHRPVVVWNLTKQCNLYCSHCYAAADREQTPGELTTTEGKRLLDDLAEYGVPVVLFSGSEPLVRDDLLELVSHAAEPGIRPVLSTNGTLITPEKAAELRNAGLAYAGIPVDGLPERNHAFRGQEGAFDAAVRGIRACLESGLKTGLRYTNTEHNVDDLEGVIELLHEEGVDRFCFYHLDYRGRGVDIVDAYLSPERKRAAVKQLCDLIRSYHEQGRRSRRSSSVTTLMRRTWSNTLDAISVKQLPTTLPSISDGTAAIRPENVSPILIIKATSTSPNSGKDTASATSGIDRSARSGTRIPIHYYNGYASAQTT